MLQFAAFSIELDDQGHGRLVRLATENRQPYSVWPHAYGHQANGGGEVGGTLAISISTDQQYVISGGGDGSCCFHFFNLINICSKGCGSSTIDSNFSLTLHTAGVSALATMGDIAVSGGKDGVSAVFSDNKK